MTEFENFLMAYDLLGVTLNIEILDIYDSLKVSPPSTKKGEGSDESSGGGSSGSNKAGLDFSGFCEALQVLCSLSFSLHLSLLLLYLCVCVCYVVCVEELVI